MFVGEGPMNDDRKIPGPHKSPSLMSNWLSQVGLVLAVCSFIVVLGLLAIDILRGFTNPYMGVLTYMIVPGGLVTGLALMLIGAWREYRRRHGAPPGVAPRFPCIDLNLPRHRNTFTASVVVVFTFLLLSAIGVFRTYHFSESVQFCGLLCHSVMKPEYTLYRKSPHARVACTQCHVGPGASWFVKSKISGVYQIYSTVAGKYSRPIPTPIDNLRPARDTCEQCHWPQKFSGSVERVKNHFLADEGNTPWTIRMLFKVGGGDPTYGPVSGIHWHMTPAVKVEYIASDKARQDIPWVRVTDPEGRITIYEAKEGRLKPEEITREKIRLMDCIDCHNRPTHIYTPPAKAVNSALLAGRIDRAIPFIKKKAVEALVKSGGFGSEAEGLAYIEKRLRSDYAAYPGKRQIETAIGEVQRIFRENIFPEMRASWKVYPDNIGHSIWPGCIRCHDGEHSSHDKRVITHQCDSCHIIIAQGPGLELDTVSAKGLEFEHPGGDIGKELLCGSCHGGALVE